MSVWIFLLSSSAAFARFNPSQILNSNQFSGVYEEDLDYDNAIFGNRFHLIHLKTSNQYAVLIPKIELSVNSDPKLVIFQKALEFERLGDSAPEISNVVEIKSAQTWTPPRFGLVIRKNYGEFSRQAEARNSADAHFEFLYHVFERNLVPLNATSKNLLFTESTVIPLNVELVRKGIFLSGNRVIGDRHLHSFRSGWAETLNFAEENIRATTKDTRHICSKVMSQLMEIETARKQSMGY